MSFWDDILGGASGLIDNFSVGDITSGIGSLFRTSDGRLDTNLLGLLGGLAGQATGLFDPNIQKVGYTKPVPKYTAVQSRVPLQQDPNRRPGSGGQRYFSDVIYANRPDVDRLSVPEAQAQAQAQADTFAAMQAPPVQAQPYESQTPVTNMAAGGLAGLAKGRYLRGNTNGMADKIPAHIDNRQKAALSHGEFVIPADVVSALGGGNSDAGAKELYRMMDRIRQQAHGKKEQMREVSPGKVLPS